MDWIKNSCKPRSISSLTILIRDFLKRWGPEEFSREGFDLDPIECLRENLLSEFVETTIEIKEVERNNQESFEFLKESIE
jgi:hypothetical protein